MATYSTKSDVKPIVGVEITNTTYDTELDSCLKAAYAWVNKVLKKHGFSVPLSSPVDDLILYAEAYKAASSFRRRRGPAAEVDAFNEQAKDFLTVYIEAEKEGTLKRI